MKNITKTYLLIILICFNFILFLSASHTEDNIKQITIFYASLKKPRNLLEQYHTLKTLKKLLNDVFLTKSPSAYESAKRLFNKTVSETQLDLQNLSDESFACLSANLQELKYNLKDHCPRPLTSNSIVSTI